MDSQERWDRFFIEMAMFVAKKSKDPSTKVGCVLVGEHNQVLSVGYNGFPRGVGGDDDPNGKRWERPIKYQFVEHAERNAIYNAARSGVSLDGAKAYLNWEPVPCADCTRGLIQSGICEIIGPSIPFPSANFDLGQDSVPVKMLREAAIERIEIKWSEE